MLSVMEQTTSREEIAENVRVALARRRGVGQADLAELLGKSQSSISDRLAGRTHFRVDELQALAQFLNVTLDQLLAPAAERSEVSA